MVRQEQMQFLRHAAQAVFDENLVNGDSPVVDRARLVGTIRGRLISDVIQAATNLAFAANDDEDAFRLLAERGIAIVNQLESALTDDISISPAAHPAGEFWRHVSDVQSRMHARKFPYMERSLIEDCAYRYLKLPYRAPLLERTLVDVLIAAELFAFSDEMLRQIPFGFRWMTQSPLMEKHVLRQYLGSRLITAVVLLGPAYLVATYGPNGQSNIAGWSIGILLVLFVVEFVWATIMLPFAWRDQWKRRQHVRNMMEEMLLTYSELAGDSQISTRRLREVAARAADKGVRWPSPLFLMLDDNISKRGSI